MKKRRTYNSGKIAGLTALLFFFCATVAAQDKMLHEVRIKKAKERKTGSNDQRLNSFSSGMKILEIDSQLMAQYALQNLGQLLSQQVPVFIRSYGLNSLATLNFRGSSSAQSQVLWNGVPLNNASLGMADVSQLGVQNFDRIQIVYGGSSALLGSGNVGAALLLDNQINSIDSGRKWKGSFLAESGSFGQYKLALKQHYSFKKWFVSANVGAQAAENNFTYKDDNGASRKMENASMQSVSGMLHVSHFFSSASSLHFSAWYQHFDRHVPPALFEKFSVKEQKDDALRLLLHYKKTAAKGNLWYSKTAFMEDRMRYDDPAIGLQSGNKTYQFYQEAGWKKQWNNHRDLIVFIPVNISWMRPSGDSQFRYQNKYALASAYSYKAFRDRWIVAANARLEKINEQTIFLPGVNSSYALFRFLTIRANVQRSYRAPTLNEWFYQPGGNPLLKPEQGWSQDAGYELKLPLGKQWSVQHDASVFNRNINDWIIWFGGSIWTPHNIAKVHSRGIETINSLFWKRKKFLLNIGLNTSFVLATTQESYIPGDGSIGKQIPYSPRYNGQANFGISYGSFHLNYNHTYTGYRFVTVDESQFLQPYQTGNLYFSCKRDLSKICRLALSVQCNNIWDSHYRVVNMRPMPGRNVALGLNFEY